MYVRNTEIFKKHELPVCVYTQLEIFCFFISTCLRGVQVEISQIFGIKQIFGCLWLDGFALVAIFHNENIYLLVLIKALAGVTDFWKACLC